MLDYDSFVATEAIYKITGLRSLFSKEINIRRYMLVLGGTGQMNYLIASTSYDQLLYCGIELWILITEPIQPPSLN